jgi:hypothetical protein
MPAIKNNNFLSDNSQTQPNSPALPILAQSRKSRQGAALKTQDHTNPLPMVFVKMEAGATLSPDQQYFMMDGAIGSFQQQQPANTFDHVRSRSHLRDQHNTLPNDTPSGFDSEMTMPMNRTLR